MKRCFSATTAQQAPVPRSARQACDWLSGTHHTALITPHCKKAHAAFAVTSASTIVSAVDSQDENRFLRIHPTAARGPFGPRGAASGTRLTIGLSSMGAAISAMVI